MNICIEKIIGQSHFWTVDTGQHKYILRYNLQVNSLRLVSQENYLFFLEETGFLRSKITVNNEYNQPVAEVQFNHHKKTGFIIWGNRRAQVDLINGKIIFNDRFKTPETVISIDRGTAQMNSNELAAILFGCLCIHIEATTQNIVKYSRLSAV